MMIIQPPSTPKRGIGLLELMLSLLVIVALLFMAGRYFLISTENLRVTQAVDMINATVNASNKWLEGKSDFSDISMPELTEAGLLPTNYSQPGANPWHGDIRVSATGTGGSQLQVRLKGVPPKSCKALIQKLQRYTVSVTCSGANPQELNATFGGST